MSIYDAVIMLFPLFNKYSFYISVFLFFFWLYKRNSKKYMKRVENKAKIQYLQRVFDIHKYNEENPNHMVQITSSWLDIYKYKFSQTDNTLLLSLVFAYISFNSKSFTENTSEDFFKFLTISTTLFLSGITYIKQRK